MKKIIYLLPFTLIGYSCNGQIQKNKQNETTSASPGENSNNPKVSVKVNKHYDKNGNLDSYDSTYTSYYSSRKGDPLLMDSLFREFKPAFREQFPFMEDKRFGNLFFNDSLLHDDFFHKDFFRKRFELNEDYLNKMMMQMDSVKNEFFRKEGRSMNNKKL